MTGSLTLGAEALSGVFWHYAAVFLRAAAMASLLPAIGETAVPARVKLAVAVALALAAAPAVAAFDISGAQPRWLSLAITEPLVGLVLGFVVRMFIQCLQIAGTIAAQSVSLSQFLGGAAEPVTAMGHALVMAGLAAAVTMGLHLRAVEFLILSYDLFPPGAWVDAASLTGWSVAQVAKMFSLAFLLAAPFVIISVLYNLTLGVINRAMPQLMVAFVGAPAITLGGIVLLCVTAPVMLSVWLAALRGFLADTSAGLP